MAESTHVGDLQIHQDLSQERMEWKIERVAWVVALLILLAALAGLLGPGPLSRAEAGEGPLRVEYNRLARYQAPEMLRIHIGPGASRGGKSRIWLSRAFIEGIELKHIDPRPSSVEAAPDRFTYTFDAADGGVMVFHFEPNTFGRAEVTVGAEGGPPVAFSQFFYP
ncbi:MAG TPA: hypothetical protein VEB22_08770 [Phycisphaerales bacterium]|nr:hypothetical protein [Phycisphaerales bacterium]